MYDLIVFLPLLGFADRWHLRPLDRRPRRRNRHHRPALRLVRAVLDRVLPGCGRSGRACSDRQLVYLRQARGRLGAAHRHADRGDAGRRYDGVVSRSRLFDRLHGRGSRPAALLRLSVAVHLRHADAGDGRQSGADVLRLGGRRPRVLPSDRLLVRSSLGQRRGDQGLRRQPSRRLRLRARHFPHLSG